MNANSERLSPSSTKRALVSLGERPSLRAISITIAVPEGQYVHGKQSYVIDYTQTDVTKYFKDSNDDEFYWDVNGTGWSQPFAEVSATVTV